MARRDYEEMARKRREQSETDMLVLQAWMVWMKVRISLSIIGAVVLFFSMIMYVGVGYSHYSTFSGWLWRATGMGIHTQKLLIGWSTTFGVLLLFASAILPPILKLSLFKGYDLD